MSEAKGVAKALHRMTRGNNWSRCAVHIERAAELLLQQEAEIAALKAATAAPAPTPVAPHPAPPSPHR